MKKFNRQEAIIHIQLSAFDIREIPTNSLINIKVIKDENIFHLNIKNA
jgi:hypothetical protein